MACFNGEYPLPYDEAFDKYVMENRRDRARLLPPAEEQAGLFPAEARLDS